MKKMTVLSLLLAASVPAGTAQAAEASLEAPLKVAGHRLLTLNTVIRVNQTESPRNLNVGTDEEQALIKKRCPELF
jgi:hypothetical protein